MEIPSKEIIKDNWNLLKGLLKSEGIYKKEPGKWHLTVQTGEQQIFKDIGKITNYYGIVFKKIVGIENDKEIYENYFRPPNEINVEHDDTYDTHVGIWKAQAQEPAHIVRPRAQQEHRAAGLKSSSELRALGAREIAKYLLDEADNYQPIYACIVEQLKGMDKSSKEIQTVTEQLDNLFRSTVEEESGKEGKKPKKTSPTSPKTSPKTKPKKVSKPVISMDVDEEALLSDSEAKAVANPELQEEMEELETKIKAFKAQAKSATNPTAKATWKKRLAEAEKEYDELLRNLGFGRRRRKSNRRRQRKTSRRTSRHKRVKHRRSNRNLTRKGLKTGRSLKKHRKRTSRKLNIKGKGIKATRVSTKRKSFGSSIYGLQGGMQTGPIYSGVYPMTLTTKETLPNLFNVKRTYSLNEFGRGRGRRRVSFGKCGCAGDDDE